METHGHEDMHAGELETSLLLAFCPEVVRPGSESADCISADRIYSPQAWLNTPSLA